MVDINYYDLDEISNDRLKFAIITSRYKDKWLFVRNKKRSTWEMPGGHREKNEDINLTASRELIEETGAKDFIITPICIYSVIDNGVETFGQLFYSNIKSLDRLPDYEIAEIKLFSAMPENITYPLVQPYLFKKIEEFYISIDK